MTKLLLLSSITISTLFAVETSVLKESNTTTLAPLIPMNNIALTDYTVVDGIYSDAYINGSFSASSAFKTNDTSTNREESSFDAHIDANFKNIYNTKSYSWTVGGNANANWTKSAEENAKTINSYDLLGYTVFDKYMSDTTKWFSFGSVVTAYKKITGTSKSLDPFLKVGAGLGYGRVYDATALAKTLRIINDLVAYGLVHPNMSADAKMALAHVIDNEDVFESKYGSLEYKKYWYKQMENVLREHHALTQDDLGAFGIVRITEILDVEKVSKRIHGWKVRTGLGKILSSQVDDSKNLTWDASFEYGLPLGLDAQFYTIATATAVLENDYDLKFNFVNTANYTYELTNSVDWENAYTFNYSIFDKADNFASHTFSTGFRYYLANRLQLSATASAVKTDLYDDWDIKLFTGITYRLK